MGHGWNCGKNAQQDRLSVRVGDQGDGLGDGHLIIVTMSIVDVVEREKSKSVLLFYTVLDVAGTVDTDN